MRIAEAWLIYILVVIVAYLVLHFIYRNLNAVGKLFIALLIGALVVFIITASITTTSDDRVWLGFLVLFAYLFPLLLGLWILFTGGYFNNLNLNPTPCDSATSPTLLTTCNKTSTTGPCKENNVYTFDGNTLYPVKSELVCTDGTTTVNYKY